MTSEANIQGEFILKILQTLDQNGFPDKKVSLPLEKLYESAHAKGINFNRILEFLSEKEGISHQKEGDRIIFSKSVPPDTEQTASSPFSGFNMDGLKNMDLGSIMSQAQELMKNLSPDQISKAQEFVKNMPPEQMEKMANMFSGMSPEQVDDLKSKAEKFLKKD